MNGTRIRVGIGGWNFEPWRGSFYPARWPQARELAYASRRLSAIEINSTYYSDQKPATFARWRRETPEGFVFTVKANRFATQRRVLAEGADSVRRFLGSGIAELGDRLGPIVWQLPPTHRFEPGDLSAFLDLLPDRLDGLNLRHVLDVRHASFQCEQYLTLARQRRVATVFTESPDYPPIADPTSDLVYARIMRTEAARPLGCAPEVFPALAACAQAWAAGGVPAGAPLLTSPPAATPRDVFIFFISGAKERAPQAALALRRALGDAPDEEPGNGTSDG